MKEVWNFRPQHRCMTSFREGEWLALPGCQWMAQVFPKRVLLCWPYDVDREPIEVTMGEEGGWLSDFEVQLDLERAAITWVARFRVETQRIAAHVANLVVNPVFNTDMASDKASHSQENGSKDSGAWSFMKWTLQSNQQGQPLLELSRATASSSTIRISGKSYPAYACEIRTKQRINLEVPGLNKVCGDSELANASLDSISGAIKLRTPDGPQIDLWMGSNRLLDWSRLMTQSEPWALAHQWIQSLRWLGSSCAVTTPLDPFAEELKQSLHELFLSAAEKWPERWWQLVRSHCIGPMAVAPGDVQGWASKDAYAARSPSVWTSVMAQLFLNRWYQWKAQEGSLYLNAQAHSRAPSGRLRDRTFLGGSLAWLWRAARTRELHIQTTQGHTLQLHLLPTPKTGRLRKQSATALWEERVVWKGKLLDLELEPDTHYRLDQLEY